jgi:hypothetical protein
VKCLEPVNLDIIGKYGVNDDQKFGREGGNSAYFDSLCIKLEPILIDQELLDVLALISLKLNHFAHLTVVDDRAIASCDELALCIVDGTQSEGTHRISS